MQKCKRCGIEQPKENFVTPNSMCDNCKHKAKLKARAKYRDRAVENSRKWYAENRDKKLKEYQKRYAEDEEYKNKKLASCKKYNDTHKELCAEKSKIYREANKEELSRKAKERRDVLKQDLEWVEKKRARGRDYYARNKEACTNRSKIWHKKNRDKINKIIADRKINDQEFYKKYKERRNKSVAKWRENNKEKRKIHSKVSKAIQTGKLTKPKNCQLCGNEFESINLIGHHSDYSKPLNVTWVCRNCHGLIHRVLDERKKSIE